MSTALRHTPSKVPTPKTGKTYLVVGGFGFLGSHLVEALLARGEEKIHIFDRVRLPLFDEEIARGTVTLHLGDLVRRDDIGRACHGVDTVFHTAAAVNYWSDLPFEYDAIHAVNVTGTENLIAGCLAEGVKQLLHTSSSSVVVPHDVVERPLEYADESTPCASAPFLCHYIQTKVLAEQAVLAANGRDGLVTAALRPGGLYGPRDQLLAAAALSGAPGVGGRTNVIDHIYVENVVHAFLLLEAKLQPGAPVCGQAYFVTNYHGRDDVDTYYQFNVKLSAAFHRRFRLAPPPLMSALAWTCQTLAKALGGRLPHRLGDLRKLRPATLALARATYYFSDRKARTDFGYQPLYSVEEAMAETARPPR